MAWILVSSALAADGAGASAPAEHVEAAPTLAVPDDAMGRGGEPADAAAAAALRRRLIRPPLRELTHDWEFGLHADYSGGVASMVDSNLDTTDADVLGFDVLSGGFSLRRRVDERWWIGVETEGGGDLSDDYGRFLLEARLSATYAWGKFGVRPEVGVEGGLACVLLEEHGTIPEHANFAFGGDGRVRAGFTLYPSDAVALRVALHAGGLWVENYSRSLLADERTPSLDARLGLTTTLVFPIRTAARM